MNSDPKSVSDGVQWIGPFLAYIGAVGTTWLGGRLKDLVSNVGELTGKIDEATSKAETILFLRRKGRVEEDAVAALFTLESEIGLLVTGLFGRRTIEINRALELFNSAIDVCDAGASNGCQPGSDTGDAVRCVREAQKNLRSRVLRSRQGWLAKIVGRKAVS